MPALFDNFRFTVNDGSGDQAVTPIASGLKRRWEQEDRVYNLKLGTKMVFRGADYTYFRDIFDAGDCTEVTLLIETYCGGEWVEWFSGKIPIREGEYNASACRVSFDVETNDAAACAKKAFSENQNWLQIVDDEEAISVLVYIGTIETTTCYYQVNISSGPANPPPSALPFTIHFAKNCWSVINYTSSSAPDPDTAWRPVSHEQYVFYLDGPEVWKKDLRTTWARERITSVTEPPGGGWISLGGNVWVRPVNVGPPVLGTTSLTYGRTWEAQTLNSQPFSNGRTLASVLEAHVALLDCGIDQVVSNFFNINPDGSAPSNDVYDYAAEHLGRIVIFQKSDIVRASASNDATRLDISLEDFFSDLRLFNVFHSIVDDDGVVKLRIEHYTYWQGLVGLDLTSLEDGKYIAGLDRFKADEATPRFESFAYQESFRPNFQTKRINYPPECVTVQGDERTAGLMCADVGGLMENQDAGLEGFVIVATVEYLVGGYMLSSVGGEPNGAFAWTNILPVVWADGRYHADATANVPGYTVNSVKKMRSQPQITIKFCCSDAFSPSDLVMTQLGEGEVKSAEQDTELGILKLSLVQ